MATSEGNLYYEPMRSLRVRRQRVIVRGDAIRRYDLRADPAEQHALPLTAEELAELEPPRERPVVGPSVELNERLRELGYLQ